MSDKMSPRGRNKTVEDKAVIDAARDIDDPCFGKKEVAEQIQIGEASTSKRLNRFVEKGTLESKKIGGAWVYWFDGY